LALSTTLPWAENKLQKKDRINAKSLMNENLKQLPIRPNLKIRIPISENCHRMHCGPESCLHYRFALPDRKSILVVHVIQYPDFHNPLLAGTFFFDGE
jgi:hypothetical protein